MELILQTNASNVEIGPVLMQEWNKIKHYRIWKKKMKTRDLN